MDRLSYRKLLPLVNDYDQMERLTNYINHRIETLRDHMENTLEVDQIRASQGALKELRRFSTLRDEVLKGSK